MDEFIKSKEFKHMTESDARWKVAEVTMQVLAEKETPELAGMVGHPSMLTHSFCTSKYLSPTVTTPANPSTRQNPD